MLTPEQLAAMRARADAATGGPWKAGPKITPVTINGHPHTVWPLAGSGMGVVCAILPDEDDTTADRRICKANLAFIKAARDDVPALLAEIERLRAEIERLRTSYEGLLLLEKNDAAERGQAQIEIIGRLRKAALTLCISLRHWHDGKLEYDSAEHEALEDALRLGRLKLPIIDG